MKYISSREFQTITDALNFSTQDCHVIGSCDLYTTKAAGGDKKLYKSIENSLESQHESLVRLSASLSPPQLPIDSRSRRRTPTVQMPEIDLSRDSPFGSLSQISARRTFAYLIATLNASHPDYEFSNILRPTDFRKTTGTSIRRSVDSTLQNMRPRRMTSWLAPPSRAPLATSAPGTISPITGAIWNEGMWDMIDTEMDLRHCEKYSWEPEDDPFEEESALWGQHHFFFNKEKKRVCYLHFRAFSVFSHSPVQSAMPMRARSAARSNGNVSSVSEGAGKRAQYWLGHNVKEEQIPDWPDDDDDEMVIENEIYEGEYTDDLDDIRDHLEDGYPYMEDDDFASDDASGWYQRGRSVPRALSEGFADAMEI